MKGEKKKQLDYRGKKIMRKIKQYLVTARSKNKLQNKTEHVKLSRRNDEQLKMYKSPVLFNQSNLNIYARVDNLNFNIYYIQPSSFK